MCQVMERLEGGEGIFSYLVVQIALTLIGFHAAEFVQLASRAV